MNKDIICAAIKSGDTVLGIELGSTRIKSVLLGPDRTPIAAGSFTWENKLVDGLWSYELSDAWKGLQESYRTLTEDVKAKYGLALEKVGAIGISGMMHGYLPFDKDGNQISMFQTWRNTNTTAAAEKLSCLFNFNIPLRWNISHLYQVILDGEEHVKDIDYMTTLAGYIHWKLTGKRVIGVGEASGMFPIDSNINDYDQEMIKKFDACIADKNYTWKVYDIMPKVLVAGDDAGVLTEEGAKLLDPTGTLCSGIPMAPPEGDAGTGMVATNSVAKRTGNVSAGTSIFSMVVLEKQLSKMYPEIDMVTTPSGRPVAMVHCNNCTSDFDAWANLFAELFEAAGCSMSKNDLFTLLFKKSLEGDLDCDGVMVYNYLSGEPITGLEKGSPLVFRKPATKFTLANFLKAEIYSTLTSLRIGMEILNNENVIVERLLGHGGLFKTPGVAQRYLAAATGAAVSVMENAGEGGPYGMALLAAYMIDRAPGEALEDYLENNIFSAANVTTIIPETDEIDGFNDFLDLYIKGLSVEKAACVI